MTLWRLITILAVLAVAFPARAVAAEPSATRRNIVFILADDLALSDMERLPDLRELFSKDGTVFERAMVSLSLCCPSRATTLRGQYAHNTGIFSNGPPDGGYAAFHDAGLETSTIATWLHAAGYRTGIIGKYLNGYPDRHDPRAIPPGWDDWVVPARGNAMASYEYTLNDNGNLVEHGSLPEDHITDVIAGESVEFIRDSAKKGTPFFAYIVPFAPHSPAVPPPRYEGEEAAASAPHSPSFNERDVADKAPWLRGLSLLNDAAIRQLDDAARARHASMLAVRDLVARVLATLSETGHLSDTYVVFASDNGYHLGEHRLSEGKNTFFEEDIRVPLYVRGPGVLAGESRNELIANADLASTFAEMAGLAAPAQCDGRSWLPLALGAKPAWRTGVLLEHQGAMTGDAPTGEYADRADPATLEPADESLHGGRGHDGHKKGKEHLYVPPFVGVRSERYTYVRYADGSRELYDLDVDPSQMKNVAASASARLLGALDGWVEAMRACVGDGCRAAEERSPTGE